MMSLRWAAWTLKNEPWAMGNHAEAVSVLRAHRIVVADFGFRVTPSALLAVFASRGAVAEYIVDIEGVEIQRD